MRAAYVIAGAVVLSLTVLVVACLAAPGSYSEDFSTTTHMDPILTEALWDAGQLTLHPLGPTVIDSFNTLGHATDVAVHGDYALVVDDGVGGVRAIDITKPDTLEYADHIALADGLLAIAIEGNYAYLAGTSSGLYVVDVTQPGAMGAVYECSAFAGGEDVVVEGDYAYVAAGASGLKIIDVSDPSDVAWPTGIHTYDTDGAAHGVAVAGDYAYVADGSSGLAVVDISPGSGPGGVCSELADARKVFLQGDYALVADGSGGLKVVNVRKPTNPMLAGSLPTSNEAIDVVVTGDYAYVADSEDVLLVVDVSDTANLRLVSTSSVAGSGRAVALHGEHAFVAAGDAGLLTFDVADAVLPPLRVAQIDCPGSPRSVTVTGDYAYVADSDGGDLRIYDISDPARPSFVTAVDTPGDVQHISIEGDWAYVAAGHPSLVVLNVSDPVQPRWEGNCPTPGEATDVALDPSGNYAYVTDGDSEPGFRVIDISNAPACTAYARQYHEAGTAHAVEVSGTWAYVATTYKGVRVFDISDPKYPGRVDEWNSTPGPAYDLAVTSTHVYVADGYEGIQVFELVTASDLEPTATCTMSVGGTARAVVVSGSRAFVASDGGGLLVYDLASPGDPSEIGTFGSGEDYVDVAVSGDYALVADRSFGVRVLDVSNPGLISAVADVDLGVALHTSPPPGRAIERLTVSGSLAYVTDSINGLHVLDISEPGNAHRVGLCRLRTAQSVAVGGGFAYVTDKLWGLYAVDVSDSTQPFVPYALDAEGYSWGVDVSGDMAFVADASSVWNQHSVEMIDVSNPTRPIFIDAPWCITGGGGECVWPRLSGDIVVAGDYVYAGGAYGGWSGFYPLDVVDPHNSAWGVSYNIGGGGIRAFDLAGDYAFVPSWGGIQVLDLTAPMSPSWKGVLSSGVFPDPADIEVCGDYGFAVGSEGLATVGLGSPYSPSVLGISPLSDARGVTISGDHAFVTDFDEGLCVFSVFSREGQPGPNAAQSLELDTTDLDIVRAELNASHTDSICWKLSSDNGLGWTEALPNGPGVAIGSPGATLIWRAELYPLGAGNTPVCDSLNIGWWYDCALIDTVVDIPEDEGRWTRVSFTRSGYDFADDSSPVDDYAVWRRVDNPSLARRVLASSSGSGPSGKVTDRAPIENSFPELGSEHRVVHLDGRTFIVSTVDRAAGFPRDTVWEYVAEVPAMQQETYTVAVPTNQDDENPHPNIFLEFDNASNFIEPAPYAPFTATVYLENFQEGEGVSATQFALERNFSGLIGSYSPLPTDWFGVFGDPETGWTIGGPCATPDTSGRIAVATVQYVYDGVSPGTLEIVPDPQQGTGRAVINCAYEEDTWTVRESPSGQGGVHASPPPGEFRPAWEVYRVSAHRADPTLWYVSPPDSGYSVDDMAPAPVRGLEIPARMTLAWTAGPEPDIDRYVVYATSDADDLDGASQVLATDATDCELPETTVGRYVYVVAVDLSGNESEPSERLWNSGTAIPDRKFLAQNVPNPFNPVTTIRFGLPAKARVTIDVYDVAGRLVTTLADGSYPPGEHEVVWNGRDTSGRGVAAGVYFYSMKSESFEDRKKMILLK